SRSLLRPLHGRSVLHGGARQRARTLAHARDARGTAVRARRTTPIHWLGLALALCAFAVEASAQQQPASATLIGRVLDAATSAPLEGATVRIEGTTLFTIADSTGRYVLARVPPGPQV